MPNIKWTSNQTTDLFKAILNLKTVSEAEIFFRDLLTLNEIDAISRRWQAVLLLKQGLPYREITNITGHSTTTVARIAHWLYHGEGGYQLILKRLNKG